MATPVATFKTAATECEMSTAIGETGTWDAYTWLDGKLVANTTAEFDAKDTKTVVPGTAQGTLTEVYAVDKHYEIVEIQTWLGEVTDFTAATYDKAGHLKAADKTDVNIFGGNDAVDLDTNEFAKGDYVLANYSNWVEDGKAIGFFLTATAPVATAAVTEIDRDDKQTTVNGTTYDWAKYYVEGNPAIAGVTYNVFEDFYGNLIGLIKPTEADPVYTIMNAYTHYTQGFAANYDAAEIVDLTSGNLEEVTVDTVDGSTPNWNDDVTKTVRKIFAFTSDEDGYDFVRPGTGDNDDVLAVENSYSIVKGTPRIVAGNNTYVTDANTVFAVEVEDDVFEIYNGYENMPSVSCEATIEILEEAADEDAKVDLVYIDARTALFAGEETFAYIMPGCTDIGGGELADGTDYDIVADVVINGEIVKVLVQDGKQSVVTSMAGKAVTLKADANGLVYAAVADDAFVYTGDVYDDNSGDVVYLTNDGVAKSYKVTTDSIVWIINLADGTVEIGTADDVDTGYRASFKLATGSDVVIDTIILFDDTSAE